jgi:DNA-binding GntR family transcriptional regulator
MPLTQEMLADATGLSTVHVNRILQQLRREKILDLRGGIACLIDRSQMQAACDYVRPTPSRWLHAPL